MEKNFEKYIFFVEEKIFENCENSFAVISGTTDKNISFVATGALFGVDVGETLKLYGNFIYNNTYGRQFKVIKFRRKMPTNERAIEKFLSSGAIEGVGPFFAKKIVETFGKKTLKILEENPEKITEVKGIGAALSKKIKTQIKRILLIKKLSIFLQEFDISANIAAKIWEKWNIFSLAKIEKNPYSLCDEDINISFSKAEEIAEKLNILKKDEKRNFAAIKYILNHNALKNGHCCVPKKNLAIVCSSFLNIDIKEAEKIIDIMIKESKLFKYTSNKDYIFLPKYFFAETYIAEKIYNLTKIEDPINKSTFENLLNLEEERLKIEFTKTQKEAIKNMVSSYVFILTGGPGTGKTTILNAAVSILEQKGLKVALCAPTGKAAKKLGKAAKKEATTIHRLLGVQQTKNEKNEFIHNEKNLLKEDVIIIDEMSMVDCLLFYNLLKATKKSIKLIICGDINQLPCILAGNILKNLITSEVIKSIKLQEIFRQSRKSLIITNAHNIINERDLIYNKKGKDFFIIEKNSPKEIERTITFLESEIIPKHFKINPKKEIQTICPIKKGIIGTININKKLQETLNPKTPSKKEFNFGFYTFREGDKILQIRNNYDIEWENEYEKGEGIFNGEIGRIKKIDDKNKNFVVDFDGKIVTLNFEMAKDIELAWAITVHKSQGSEFLSVVIPVFFKSSEFFSQNLIYTAITRAEKLVIIVGSKKSLKQMCMQKKVNYRYSCLKNFLQEKNI